MSYWVYLEKNGEPVDVPRHAEGGTIAIGGEPKASINVTYNYSRLFSVKEVLDGKKAGDTIVALSAAVLGYDIDRDPDYWKPTPGNVGHMCSILLAWARQHPDAIWRIS